MEIPLGELKSSMHRLSAIYRLRMHGVFGKTPLHFGQYPILRYIMEHDGCTQRELAQNMMVSPPSIATSMKRMQRAGLVCKSADKNDQRCSRLSLTDEGRSTVLRCQEELRKMDADLFKGFSEEECTQIAAFINRMSDNLATDDLKGKSVASLFAQEINKLNDKKEGCGRG
ncbi:MarR family winged helix-turn-helix transcriptional regulator [Acetanaerobacterium elongatum]|uniref:DNA-binding transcriptional regulator, MarR family n=1 Tax=Acetanaerobacterium elongatum TaxID=258515 RepID=A0A1H0C6Q4_9FIRM|nr:MarR family transcriptional regulator [Acetanaerobacterium elongatum]SDN53570.1 DNA-binding transcriptional regulator, MarR family [Acetanaerobacterium elongatum]